MTVAQTTCLEVEERPDWRKVISEKEKKIRDIYNERNDKGMK